MLLFNPLHGLVYRIQHAKWGPGAAHLGDQPAAGNRRHGRAAGNPYIASETRSLSGGGSGITGCRYDKNGNVTSVTEKSVSGVVLRQTTHTYHAAASDAAAEPADSASGSWNPASQRLRNRVRSTLVNNGAGVASLSEYDTIRLP
jgi:hypothetical protein